MSLAAALIAVAGLFAPMHHAKADTFWDADPNGNVLYYNTVNVGSTYAPGQTITVTSETQVAECDNQSGAVSLANLYVQAEWGSWPQQTLMSGSPTMATDWNLIYGGLEADGLMPGITGSVTFTAPSTPGWYVLHFTGSGWNPWSAVWDSSTYDMGFTVPSPPPPVGTPTMLNVQCAGGNALLTWAGAANNSWWQPTIKIPYGGGCPTGWAYWTKSGTDLYCGLPNVQSGQAWVTGLPAEGNYSAFVFANYAGNWSAASNSLTFSCPANWTTYCSGPNNHSVNDWTWWQYDNLVPQANRNYRYLSNPNGDPACSPPAPTSPVGTCSADGTSATFSWTSPSSYYTTFYTRLYLNSWPGNKCPSGWTMYTDNKTCMLNGYPSTAASFAATPGTVYSAWSQTDTNSGNYSSTAASATIDCTALPAPTSITETCVSGGTQITIAWAAVPGASIYRANLNGFTSAAQCPSGWSYSAGDCYLDGITGTSVTVTAPINVARSAWVSPGRNGTMNFNVNAMTSATCVSTVNGACGASNGVYTATKPASGLCTSGSASAVSGSNPWSWSCTGSGTPTGSTANCATLAATTVNGACGTANGVYVTTAPYGAAACSSGTLSGQSGNSSSGFQWTCLGSGTPTGSSPSCASAAATTINGVCGTANGQSFATAPTTNLCAAGTPSVTPSGSGPWNWSCNGSGTPIGNSPSCSATQLNPAFLYMTASQMRVRKGGSFTVSYSATHVNNCALSGITVPNSPITTNAVNNAIATTTQTITNVQTSAIYTLSCNAQDGSTPSLSMTVSLDPMYNE